LRANSEESQKTILLEFESKKKKKKKKKKKEGKKTGQIICKYLFLPGRRKGRE